MTDAENALTDIRLEYVGESTFGVIPDDPSWNRYTADDHLSGFSFSTDGNKEPREVVGQVDPAAHDRSTESATATINYRQSQFLVDGSNNIQDPAGIPIKFDDPDNYPSHTILARRDVGTGGADGGGFREFHVITGARPVSAEFDGDPGEGGPLPQTLGYEAQRARTHIVHQPSSSTELVVKSDNTNDDNDVIIENDGAGTTETVTLPTGSPNEVETTSTFSDIDAIEVQGDHAGDITVGTSDGASPPSIDVQLTEDPITGSDTDGVDSLQGIPALGSGSHASTISDSGPIFLGTDAKWVNDPIASRVHAISLSVERDTERNGQQTTRGETIDVGARSVSASVDLAGPYKTAELIKEHHRDASSDLVWTFDSSETITLKNAQIVDAPDQTREAGDTTYIPSATLEPSGDPAITQST